MFPVIANIKDVLPYLEAYPEFIVVDKGDYKVINYIYQSNETFSSFDDDDNIGDAVRRECRGLIFDSKTGQIIRRPLHKFFNVGEKDRTQFDVLNFAQRQFDVMEKIDGSMIAPFYVNGDIRLGTRMGITDVAMKAEEYVASKLKYKALMNYFLSRGYTPIFEWVDKDIPIVIPYTESSLTLIAVRHMVTGSYLSRKGIQQMCLNMGLPFVKTYSVKEMDKFVSEVREEKDNEGYVIQFSEGEMVKLKTEWYVKLHRIKDRLCSKRNAIEAVITNKMDDVYSMLSPENLERLLKFEEEVWDRVNTLSNRIISLYEQSVEHGETRKDFALYSGVKQFYKSGVFYLMDGGEAQTYVFNSIIKHLSNEKRFNIFNKDVLKVKGEVYGEYINS